MLDDDIIMLDACQEEMALFINVVTIYNEIIAIVIVYVQTET